MIEESENTENMYAYWFELIGLMCMLLELNLRGSWKCELVFISTCYMLVLA